MKSMSAAGDSTNPLKTKQHFQILDGLRGVAAVSVVIFHFMEIAQPDYEKNFIGHAFLAVDFFFCLSGFVIAYAYDQARLDKIGFGTFLKLRLIRLHPLVIIGAIIGLLSWLFDPYSNLSATYGYGKAFLMFITSCFMIPYPLVRERYFNSFHLNAPSWSLFWEYIANIIYALVLVKFRNKILWILLVIGAGLIIYETSKSGNISYGWGGDNVSAGAIRVFYSFLAGMLVYRSSWIIKSRLGFAAISVLTLAVFLFPFSNKWNYVTESVIVIFYLPLLVALGAGATLRPVFSKICKFSGELSYPLYMVHYPFIWIFFSYLEKYKPTMDEKAVIIPICTALLIGFAWLVLKFIDEPIRKYFKVRMEAGPVVSR
jgi:peptidoglycan/LPS O-acetylase OafA/YrhL